MGSDASRYTNIYNYKLASLKVPRGNNLTDAELSEQDPLSQHTQQPPLKERHRL